MSRLGEMRQAYDRLAQLLDQEILNRKKSAKEMERFRAILDEAFYLSGWGEFEGLVTKAVDNIIAENIRSNTVEYHAWRHLKDSGRNFTVSKRLDLIFHENSTMRESLRKDYILRNTIAHDNARLPKEGVDISVWLGTLDGLVEKFNR